PPTTPAGDLHSFPTRRSSDLSDPNGGDATTKVSVCSSLFKLREEAARKTLAEYSALCGVPVEEIEGLAREFTSHGKKAVANSHRSEEHTSELQSRENLVCRLL